MPKPSSLSTRRRSRSNSREYNSRQTSKSKDRDYYKTNSRRSTSKSKIDKIFSKSKKKKVKRKKYRSRSSSSLESNHSVKLNIKHSTRECSVEKKTESLNVDAPNKNILDKINEDCFTQSSFSTSSSTMKAPQNNKSLKSEQILMGTVNKCNPKEESTFHPNFLGDEVKKLEKWARKLYSYRKRTINE